MKPHPRQEREEQDDLLRPRLTDMIDMRHELATLAALIDWEFFEREWAGFFPSHRGRPATSPRLVAGCCKCRMKIPQKCRTKIPHFRALRWVGIRDGRLRSLAAGPVVWARAAG